MIEYHLSPCFEKLIDNQIDILLLAANLNGNLILILTSYLMTKHTRSSWFGILDQLGRQLGGHQGRLFDYGRCVHLLLTWNWKTQSNFCWAIPYNDSCYNLLFFRNSESHNRHHSERERQHEPQSSLANNNGPASYLHYNHYYNQVYSQKTFLLKMWCLHRVLKDLQ